ncbi:tetraacyldisaccharide 4'-kinase [Chlamydia ibidis]|uniref:Tetraacyldisaccharide 4'-kinase n=2 Tax=Chlamydia ibidis TaxID=1405396 RepID=S7KLT8_9CHLA|nr:tetraacyldisaccharide 4'-kinase [Chlamydia ibidis]EPP35405.1 tetraacyldisaccharide 4'-kinase [Chlamydia ibidis]EQM62850.1 tetraacyldisaccharide 4'-kinase [Chlamydia ibidis 10-1398/6]
MKSQFPSPLFILYRRLTVAISFGRFLRFGLLGKLLSCAFAFLVVLRRTFNLRAPYRSSSTVVSIGNIVLGGSGKTPTVLWLVEALRSKGYSCAVLTRGYKSICSRKGKLTIVDPSTHNAGYVGDEPLLMAGRLPPETVWVHKDRRLSARNAASKFDILVLDDGLQYDKLHKDVEIVVVNGQDPLGQGKFFPIGRLRDFPSKLKNVGFAIVNGQCSQGDRKILERWCDAPKIYVEPRISEIVWENTQEKVPVERLKGLAVGVFCGLGFPKGFLTMLQDAGVKILGTYLLPDHVSITRKELRYFSHKIAMRLGDGILCTEKDSVKIRDFLGESGVLPVGRVVMRFSITEGRSVADDLLDSIVQIHKSKG